MNKSQPISQEARCISKALNKIRQNPKNDFERLFAELPCMQALQKNDPNDPSLKDWLDGQDAMRILHISARTLQSLRTNGTLPCSRIGNKIYYQQRDIQKVLSDNYTMYKIRNSKKQ